MVSSATVAAIAQPTAADGPRPGDGQPPPDTASIPPRGSPSGEAPRELSRDEDPWYSSGLFGTDPRDPIYLPFGLLVSWPFERVLGVGGEVSLDIYHRRSWHWGLVAQAEYEIAPGANRGRFALGPQVGIPFLGIETAAAVRTATPEHAASLAPHLAPYISALGFVSVALRFTGPGLALDDSGRDAWPWELGLAFTLKWPLSLQADLYCSAAYPHCDSQAPRPRP